MASNSLSPLEDRNIPERITERVRSGEISAADGNVELVRALRVRIIKTTLRRDVRAALNAGVRVGKLGHLKKDGHKPEVYYHPEFEYLVPGVRNAHAERVLRALAGVLA